MAWSKLCRYGLGLFCLTLLLPTLNALAMVRVLGGIPYHIAPKADKPSAPLAVHLSLTGVSSLNQTGVLVLTATPRVDAPNTELAISLPEGLAFVGGILDWVGDIPQGQSVTIEAEVQARELGNWTIEAHATSGRENDTFGGADFIYVSISKDSLTISKENPWPVPSTSAEEVRVKQDVRPNQQVVNQTKPGTVTVYGWLYFYEQDGSTERRARHVDVELYDEDFGGVNTWLATTTTGEDGYFEFPAVEQNDGLLEDGYDVWVQARSQAYVGQGIYVVTETGTNVYGANFPVDGNVADGYHLYCTECVISINKSPFAVLDTVTLGWEYAHSLGWDHPQPVRVYWPSDGTYTESANPNRIHLTGNPASGDPADSDVWDEDVILHEFGHSVQYYVYGGWVPNSGGSHSWNQHTNPNFAWSEGWANYFGVVASQEMGYGDSLFPKDSLYKDTIDQTITHDLETDPHVQGDDTESTIACILWDIYDTSDDGRDTLDGTMAPIWDVFGSYSTGGHHVYTIHDFWYGWLARGHDHKPEVRGIYLDHGIVDAWSLLDGLTPDASALASSSSRLFLAARGMENGIWYRSMDSTESWSAWTRLPGLTDARPAIAVFNSRLYFVCKQAGSNKIWVGYYPLSNGVVSGSFSGWLPLDGPTPAAVSLSWSSNYLYLAAEGMDGSIWHRRMDASGTWSLWVMVPGFTDISPAIAVFQNRLYFVCKQKASNNIWYGYVDLVSYPGGWSGWTLLSGPTPDTLGLASSSDRLYLAARGMENGIWYRSMDASGSWSDWSRLSGFTDVSPGIAVFNAKLYFGCREAGANNMWYC